MSRSWPLAMALWLAWPAGAADVQVRVNGSLVDIQATAAPLQDVLARLAQQTGMKVVYDGPPPRTLVTLTLAGRTPPEAVLALFEGLGANYAMISDRTGLRVDTLLITSAASGSAGSSTSAASRPGSGPAPPPAAEPRRPQRPVVNDTEPDDDQDDDAGRPRPPGLGAGGAAQGGPAQPSAPFGGQILPLTMPTPAPPAATAPSPGPSPTPSPGRPGDR